MMIGLVAICWAAILLAFFTGYVLARRQTDEMVGSACDRERARGEDRLDQAVIYIVKELARRYHVNPATLARDLANGFLYEDAITGPLERCFGIYWDEKQKRYWAPRGPRQKKEAENHDPSPES